MKKEQVFLVGGAVRDILLGIDPKDKDYVVVGYSEKDMLKFGFEQVGKDFPVFLHPKTGEEYALARKERKTGAGYGGFSVETKDVTLEEDLFRRDLTINSMAMSHDGKLIDPYNGRDDLENRILRHVSVHFSEDPVRILRLARFSARYDFQVAEPTLKLMEEMVKNGEFDSLTPERVWKEFDKVLGEKHIHRFFDILDTIGALPKIPGFSKIKEDNFFRYIRDKQEEVYIPSLLHTFSQMEKSELEQWKMPAEDQQKIIQFKNWKDNELFYSYLDTIDKIKFITLNRSLQSQERSLEIIDNVCLYQSWNQSKPLNNEMEKELFIEDIKKLKTIDYTSIVDEAKSSKQKPNDMIRQYQMEILQPKKTPKP
jgi:tRNA nucleotidyltransferase/poly(A) polymerase